jgi:hypothetical protein
MPGFLQSDFRDWDRGDLRPMDTDAKPKPEIAFTDTTLLSYSPQVRFLIEEAVVKSRRHWIYRRGGAGGARQCSSDSGRRTLSTRLIKNNSCRVQNNQRHFAPGKLQPHFAASQLQY